MISRRTHLRNIAVSAVVVTLVLMLGLQHGFAPENVLAQAPILTPTNSPQTLPPGVGSVTFNLSLNNATASTQTFTLTAPSIPNGLTATFTSGVTVTVNTGQTATVTMRVDVGGNVASGPYLIQVQAASPTVSTSTTVQLIVAATTATSTNTATPSITATPAGSITLAPVTVSLTGDAGTFVNFTFTLTNNGTGTVNAALSTAASVSNVTVGFSVSQITVPAGQNSTFQAVFAIDQNATAGPRGTIQIKATDQNNSNNNATAFVQFSITVNGATVTPTGTATQTLTPTPTVGPSLTASPPICQDSYEGDGDMGSAKEIQINLPQPSTSVDPQVPGHTICPEGDEDWLFFGGLAGKVYTIDVSDMALGLDLSLTLYDANGKQLAFNDDYSNRAQGTPDARAPGAAATGDIKPRIQSWTAPANGRYYIQVRDAAGGGRRRGSYTIQLLSESYGPTPTQDSQLCQDLYEPDGLPEEARQIGPNEIQPLHTFCPTGDADWIKFFGAAGKTYFIFTDTRPYASNSSRPPNLPVNPGANGNVPEAGADTIIYLTDRDGVSLLDFNDDIAGGSTLDSQIEFTPSVDGFYFMQVKNRGDLGNQFIRYDLTVQLCLPGQTTCGRPNATPAPPTVPAGETTQPTEFNLEGTPTPTGTTAAANGGASAATLAQSRALAAGFADPAFQRLWQRDDQPVADQRVERTWVWGPKGRTTRGEDFRQVAGGQRMVQYFDKGRMEINDPSRNRADPEFVTSGLLVQEMITGRIQVGMGDFVDSTPAQVVMAGDANDPNAATYASLHALVGQRALNLTGEVAGTTLARDGSLGTYTGPARADSVMARFVQETGHNIPAIFWNYLQAQGVVFENGQYVQRTLMNGNDTLGYPISEPYWVRVHSGGSEHDVLLQAFERRILTYSPDNPPGWQVEMGNVGLHYYLWRYGQALT